MVFMCVEQVAAHAMGAQLKTVRCETACPTEIDGFVVRADASMTLYKRQSLKRTCHPVLSTTVIFLARIAIASKWDSVNERLCRVKERSDSTNNSYSLHIFSTDADEYGVIFFLNVLVRR